MYWLFCGYVYYPSGGLEDFYGAYDSVSDAMAAFEKLDDITFRWAHIADMRKTIAGRDKPFEICLEFYEGDGWHKPD